MDEKTQKKETAAAEKHLWMRLTRVCNNRCVFCLDKQNHDGTVVPYSELVADFRAGKKNGATRLILSGGEATLHPDFFKLVCRAKLMKFRRIQLVTNGRMFAYPDFLERAIDAGLDETTFSIHGHTPELHDAQTRIPGSFAQTFAGLMNALNSGKLIVNIDIVINKHNYRQIDRIMDFFIARGVTEFDLLHVTPFGEAWENRRAVMYDPAEGIKYLNKAFSRSRRPDLFVWTNRFPPSYLTAFPELIQNPVKIKDEVRGRMNLFDDFIERGQPMMCRDSRCRYCFMEGLCDELFRTNKALDENEVKSLRVETRQLGHALESPLARTLDRLYIHGGNFSDAAHAFNLIPDGVRLTLDFENYSGLEKAARKSGGRKNKIIIRECDQLDPVSDIPGSTIYLELNAKNQRFITDNAARLIKRGVRLFYRNRTTLESVVSEGVDFANFFKSRPARGFRTLNIPACIIKTNPERLPWFVDYSVIDAKRGIDMQKLADAFIEHRYYVYPAECRGCVKKSRCPGLHVNQFRAFGFRPRPIKD